MNAVKRILVTGSSGMIGTALCEELQRREYEVTGADIRHNGWSRSVDNATVICDLRYRDFFNILPPDFDMVIHLAANARVFYTVVEPALARDNFEIMFNVLEFSRLNNIARIIFASSREVYGNSHDISFSEDEISLLGRCESPYAATKIGAEALLAAYGLCYNLDYIVFRLSNVYGKYDDSNRVIPHFIKKTSEGEDLTVFGVEKLLDFTYISDCSDAITSAIESFDRVKNNVFNIASGEGTTLLEVAKSIISKTGANGRIVVKDSRPGEVVKYVANICKATELLNYQPRVRLDEGIDKTIKWYRETGV